MSEDNDFFGDVFDDPQDDPLLGNSPASSGDSSSEPPDRPTGSDSQDHGKQQGPPSWMSDEPNTNGTAPSTNGTEPSESESSDPNRKEIVVDQQGDAGAGIDALNQAVGQGWRLVRISLARPDGEQAATPQAAHRFVAILEQDRPQSLFDFGATA
jgi:hypothetical protein